MKCQWKNIRTDTQNHKNRNRFIPKYRFEAYSMGIFVLVIILSGCTKNAPEYEFVIPENDIIKIRTASVNDNCVHFFTFRQSDKNINFFIRTDGNGKLHTHYDACYSCFKYKLGFKVEGDHIRCIACNLEYQLSEEFWDYIGACAPIPLSSNIQNDFIEIKLSAVQKGEKLF